MTAHERVSQQLAQLNPQITKPSRRIYVGNLPLGVGLDETKVVDFLTQACEIIGIKTKDPVVSCWMSADKTFCFVEFRGVQDAENAKKLLAENQIKLGERFLRFGRPKDFKAPPPHLESYTVGGKDPPLPDDMDVAAYIEDIYGQYPKIFRQVIGGEIDEENMTGPIKTDEGQTRVLLLDKMVNLEDITKEETYRQIFVDIKSECKKYGHVRKLLIPRPGYVKGDFGVGKIYVQFDHIESAIRAKDALEKRRFDGHEIGIAFYDEARFIKKKFF